MMRSSARFVSRVSALVLVLAVTTVMFPAAHSQNGTDEAYFVFSVSPYPDTFVFKLTNPSRIQEARDILRSGANKIVTGVIIKQPVYYNPPWSFHFDPATIGFADITVELCDANIRYVEDHLDTVYPQWCPWGTRLLREIAPPSKPGTGNLNPTVSMTFPHADNSYGGPAPANLTLSANADDPDGLINKVEFLNGETRIGDVSTRPYMLSWNNLAPGAYSVSAIATDNQGAVSTSKNIKFTITQPSSSNPIDDQQFFVTQHYRDFLGREPDASGQSYWANEINRCGTDLRCIDSRRVGVSAAFFIESEFQENGGFLYRCYKATYGAMPAYAQFTRDRAKIVAGIDLEAGKQAFTEGWTQRLEFLTKYPASLSGPQFVDALLQTVLQGSGVDLSGRRQVLIDEYSVTGSRPRVLRIVADDPAFEQAEYNGAFVLLQYFGYLHRDPDLDGYYFWLDVLNQKTPGNFRGMVCAFLTSAEYQSRFSTLRTHNDSICSGLLP